MAQSTQNVSECLEQTVLSFIGVEATIVTVIVIFIVVLGVNGL